MLLFYYGNFTVLVIAAIVFVIFVDTISITYTISSHTIFKSTILFKYLLFSQIHAFDNFYTWTEL